MDGSGTAPTASRSTGHRVGLHLMLLLFGAVAAACQLGAEQPPPFAGPTPIPFPTPSPIPAAEVTFQARTPADTPSDAELALVLLDEVTGFAFNRRTVPMAQNDAGLWQATVDLPHGALQYYRYELINPPRPERDSYGTSIPARVVLIQTALQVHDVIAGWAEGPTRTPSGQAYGHLTDTDGNPLAEQIVVLAGNWAFTDGEGAFAFQAIPAGQHWLTAFSPDGAYRPAQQGVLVSDDGLTPIELQLEQTARVRVTLVVTVPDDTVPGGPPRIAGNLRQLGQRFVDLPGGLRGTSLTMPVTTRVDDTHYLWISELPVGAHVRYKYTLGNGLWNAERSPEGFFHLREVTIPANELQLEDTVSSWRGQHGSVLLQVAAPTDTPQGDNLSLQLNPAAGFAPLPMQQLAEQDWFFVLHGPLDLAAPLSYRYCRNLRCGAADDAATAGPSSTGRQVTLNAAGTTVQDSIERWQWWGTLGSGESIVAPEIGLRPDLELGMGFTPDYHPDWLPALRQAMPDLRADGANAVVLRPGWAVRRTEPTPLLALDPSRGPFGAELLSLMEAARAAGLSVTLQPSLHYPAEEPSTWWDGASRTDDWWIGWFAGYRSFLLRYASLAELGGARRLVLGGPEAAPFLPSDSEAEGQPVPPPDAEGRWRTLIEQVRSIYHGELAFELELGTELQTIPPFLAEFDRVQLYWHAPLGERPDLSITEMREAATQLLDATLNLEPLATKPIVLSIGYPSLDGGAGPCAAPAGGECPGPTQLLAGTVEGTVLPIDLQEQAWAVNAMLLEAYTRPQITGIFARDYDPLVALQDDTLSVHGKPAAEVLSYWYSRLTEPGGG